MQFSDKMIEVKKELEKLGHEVSLSGFIEQYKGKSHDDIETLKTTHKFEQNAAKEFWSRMITQDAILIINIEKNGVKNYIGGAALNDMAIAHFLNQKIFLWNPIPDIPYYKKEIESMKPVVINGDLGKIR